jgi:hypothetical protein
VSFKIKVLLEKQVNISVALFDSTISCPNTGIADNKLVITVAPHRDICPNGST